MTSDRSISFTWKTLEEYLPFTAYPRQLLGGCHKTAYNLKWAVQVESVILKLFFIKGDNGDMIFALLTEKLSLAFFGKVVVKVNIF